MSDTPHIVLKPAPDAPSEHELDVLAAIYRLALKRYEDEKAAPPSGPNDAMKGSKGDSAITRLP